MQGLQDLDELLTQAVLERDPPGVEPARDEEHLLVLDVDALHPADSFREVEDLRLAEWWRGEPAAVALVDDRRVEALLDRRPDGERRGEGVAVDDQVGPVAHADLVDRAEQLL